MDLSKMLCFDLCGCKKNTLAALALVDEQSASEGQIMAQRTVVEIRCQLEEFSDFLPSGFLAMVAKFASDIDFFKPFEEHLKVPIKQVYYSMVQKIQTIMASIAVGCSHIKDINHKLRPYRAVAQLFGMPCFPDQSQINRFLRRFDGQNILELGLIFELLLKDHGLFSHSHRVDIDFDCTGIVVSGKTYQLSRKGYFPRKRGCRGYQLSMASSANTDFTEILSLHLDPGNIHHGTRLWDAIYQVAEMLGSFDRFGIIRTDAANGVGTDVQELIELGLDFVLKGYSTKTAQRLAKDVCQVDWHCFDFFTRLSDLGRTKIPSCRYPVRVVLVETLTPKGKKVYHHLYTSLSDKQIDAFDLFSYYNGRQTIEALIRAEKNAFYINQLRTRDFFGAYAFFYLAAMTFNLMTLFRYHVLRGTDLENLCLVELIHKLMDIPAKINYQNNQLELTFPKHHRLINEFLNGSKTNNLNLLNQVNSPIHKILCKT
jgi:hypothetical protein